MNTLPKSTFDDPSCGPSAYLQVPIPVSTEARVIDVKLDVRDAIVFHNVFQWGATFP